MSTTIDQKVVEMRFDNKQFESGVQTSMSTLDKLKQSLNLNGASKGLDGISKAASNVDFSGMSNGVETVRARFSALQVMGITALTNITNSAMNAGKKIISALTIDPIKTGFQEYETQINAVQTILANTQKEGTTIKDVNGALDELNTYADKTIYNFTEMTRNIGTFTAAGVDLKTSVNAIQGIANLAAVSGSTSQQASTAMYQLSQALATGTVKLMDWNSVVNAGMGGQLFQDALKETSALLGTGAEAAIKAKGSFRESLQTGWLTSEVLTETLKKFTTSGATEQVAKYTGLSKEAVNAALEEAEARYGEADAIDQASKALAKKSGKNADEIKSALQFAKTAEDAATKVKTLTQLWDTLKEAAQSGWSQTWRIVVGDFEEAKALFTEISDTIGGLIGKSADARNKVLSKWSDLGGRNDLIESLRNVFEGISSIVKPINEAFREIFPPVTAKQLFSFTEGLKNLTDKLKISDETSDKLKRTFSGLFAIVNLAKKAFLAVGGAVFKLLTSDGMAALCDLVLTVTAAFGDFFTAINKGFKMDGISKVLSSITSGISNFVEILLGDYEKLGTTLTSFGKIVSDFASDVWNGVVKVFEWITDNVSVKDIFAGLVGGSVFASAKKLYDIFSKIYDILNGNFKKGKMRFFSDIKEKISDTLDGVHESLTSFTSGVKVASLVSIAVAVGILAASLKSISKLKGQDISKSLFAIGAMMTMLSLTFRSLTKTLNKFDSKGVVKSSLALVLVASSMKILSDAVIKLSGVPFAKLLKGLIGLGIGLAELSVGLKIIGKTKISLSTSIAMIALAESCKMLGDAVEKFGNMSWDEIKRGLSSMGGALAEFVAALAILNKFGGFNSLLGSVGILIAVQSLDEISENLKKFGSMSWDEIKRGLSSMGGALAEVSVVTGALGKLAGFSGILGAGSILITVQSLGSLADAFGNFGNMSWDQIKAGLAGMGGALAEVGIITGALGKLAGFSGILGSGAILITIQGLADLANAFEQFGNMTWDQIKAGLAGMGGALAEVAIITGSLGVLAGFSGLLGGGSLLLAVQSLGDLANAFSSFGSMTWDQIKAGLAGMGGALAEVGVVAGSLGTLTGISGLLGGGSLLLAVQSLGDLADAFKIFGNMTWDEIKAGLVGMGGALAEVATITGLLGSLAGLGALIGGGALLLSAQALETIATALGTLSDSVRKWNGVTIPENLGSRLAGLAKGVLAFTFDGLGASAISTVAGPLGVLADSVKKWTGVTVPDRIGEQLKGLSSAVKTFTFAGLGAGAISTVAEPLGALASSVKKWSNVNVPENIDESLGSIAKGVKSFSWLFTAGWSLSTITGPLGKLADSVKKWTGVTVPSGISDGLKSISSGLKSFTWLFVAGWSLSTITGPFSKLADGLKKLNGIKIPSKIEEQLKSVANGIKSFSGIGDISSASKNVESISSSISSLSRVNFKTISSGLNSFAKSIKNLSSTSSSLSNIGTKITSMIINPIKKVSSQLKGVGANIITSLVNGIKSKQSSLKTISTNMVSTMEKAITSKTSSFKSAGQKCITEFISGLNTQKSKATSAVSSMVSSASSKIRGQRSSFYNAGTYLGSGLVSGINSKKTAAYNAGYALGKAAVKGEKDGQKSNSPSKLTIKAGKWLGEGLVIGMKTMGSKVYNAGYKLGDITTKSISSAVSKVSDLVDSGMDSTPTIRPVLDLTDVKAGADSIGSMFGINPSVGVLSTVGSINSSMNQRNQNGINDDVVSAIDKLRKDMGNVGGNTYNINGVTYDDGTNVSNAVEELVRAVRIEGRV